jgi:hypothetical protein
MSDMVIFQQLPEGKNKAESRRDYFRFADHPSRIAGSLSHFKHDGPPKRTAVSSRFRP